MSGTMNDTPGAALSRRDFISLTAAGVAALAIPRRANAKEAPRMLYVGTYTDGTKSKGIYRVRLSSAGALSLAGLAAETSNPSFVALSPDARFAFAVNELSKMKGVATGAVTSFNRRMGDDALHELGQVITRGADPCYVSTDNTGRFLFVAN
jgi:6-phosphogluconolactonase